MEYHLRPFQPGDAAAVNAVALAAFAEYRAHCNSWPAFSRLVGNMVSLGKCTDDLTSPYKVLTAGPSPVTAMGSEAMHPSKATEAGLHGKPASCHGDRGSR